MNLFAIKFNAYGIKRQDLGNPYWWDYQRQECYILHEVLFDESKHILIGFSYYCKVKGSHELFFIQTANSYTILKLDLWVSEKV